MIKNAELNILHNTFGWSKSKIAKELGLSHVTVLKWFRGSEIRKQNCEKLKALVQASRFHVKQKLTSFSEAKRTNPGLSLLRHFLNCGVAYEDIAKTSGLSETTIRRKAQHPTEQNGDFIARMFKAFDLLEKIYAEEKVIDLLDTTAKPPYDPLNDPVFGSIEPANQSPLPDEAKGKNVHNSQVPW